MKILVTGANGFLGRHVVDALRRRGYEVRAMVRPASEIDCLGWGSDPEIEIFRADLRVARDLPSAFDGVSVLVHLAAAVTGGDDAQFAAAVVGTERLLDAMGGSEVRRVVLASSFSVYDYRKVRGRLTEDSPILEGPGLYERDGYAIAKTWQERAARRIVDQQGRELVVMRPGTIWGRGNELPARAGVPIGRHLIVVGPMTRLPLVHVENCADAFALAAEAPEAAGENFNVVDDIEISNWAHVGEHRRHGHCDGFRVPIPYHLARPVVGLAKFTSRVLFRGKGKLPSVLVPCRFVARFGPIRLGPSKLARRLGWRPPLDRRAQLERTYGTESTTPAPSAEAATAHA